MNKVSLSHANTNPMVNYYYKVLNLEKSVYEVFMFCATRLDIFDRTHT